MEPNSVLIYDGDCQFCRLSLDFGLKTLPLFPKYVAFQRINPADFDLTSNDVRSQIWLVSPGSKPLGGHLAVAQLLKAQSAWHFRLLGWSISTPPFSHLAKLGYSWVARNRHRLPGGSRVCQIEDSYQEK